MSNFNLYTRYGRVYQALGPIIKAGGDFRVGEICKVTRNKDKPLLAEVVGFEGSTAVLTPYGPLNGVSARSKIWKEYDQFTIGVGEELVGRVLDSTGAPLDGNPPPVCSHQYPGMNYAPEPMSRPIIKDVFQVGIRAIDGLLTIGVGQRVGIFAAAGGGKSTLLSMLARFSSYDICVIALIGERGREVKEFIDHNLGEEGMRGSVLIIATSDRPAIEQVKAAYTATSIAEYFRDQGKRVLLLMDSLTRFARAQRQIGLSAGEPPTRRGFPPSVFEVLPGLVERAGLTPHGSITALYTVLVEGDDMSEPVADEVRSLLDGHIILSKKIAESGRYPAIDVLSSVSRVFNQITPKEDLELATLFRSLLSKYNEVEMLIRLGEYEHGQDKETDGAIQKNPSLLGFLEQGVNESSSYDEAKHRIREILQ